MTTSNANTATTRELPAGAQPILDEIAGVLSDGGSVPDVRAELTARLAALAQTYGIDQTGDQTVKPGQRSEIKFDPLVDLPPVSSPKGTFTIEAAAAWEVLDANGTVLRTGEHFHAPDLDDLELGVLLAPRVVELTREQPQARAFGIRVRLTLSMTLPATFFTPAAAAPQKISGSATVPGAAPLRLSVLPLAVPTLLALFRHKNFRSSASGLSGFVVVVVDTDSPLGDLRDLPALKVKLNALSQAIAAVTAVLPNLPPVELLREFVALATAVNVQPQGRVKVATKVGDVHEIRRLDRVGIPTDSNALDAGNAISSLVLLSPGADVVVECWNGGDFAARAARFDLIVGSQRFILIEDLAIERTKPVTIPPDRLKVIKPPGAFNSFNDGISAIRIRRT